MVLMLEALGEAGLIFSLERRQSKLVVSDQRKEDPAYKHLGLWGFDGGSKGATDSKSAAGGPIMVPVLDLPERYMVV